MKANSLISIHCLPRTAAFLLNLLAVILATGHACSQIVEIAADIVPGPRPSSPLHLTVFNGELFFTASDGVHGRELWRFDGTTASLVADSVPGIGTPAFRDFTEFNGDLYFYGTVGSMRGIWKFDSNTISIAAEVNPGTVTGGANFMVYNGSLYFESRDFSPGPNLTGSELWKFDGSTASLAADIRQGNNSSYPKNFVVYDGNLYFSAYGIGGGLWKYDGTTASVASNVENPGFFMEFDGNLYFRGEDDSHGTEMWKYDGTTAYVIDIQPGSSGSGAVGFTVFNDTLYFAATDGQNGNELWKFDGTTASLAADINPSLNYPRDSNPNDLMVINGILYFSADDGEHGKELWRFDGISASLVTDLNPGPSGSNPRNFAVYDGALYFRANDGSKGEELWRLIPDADGDSIPDSLDRFPNSDLRPTVFVENIDSGVFNALLPDGATVADLVNSASDGPGRSGLADVLNDLKKDGLISGKDKGTILKASNTP